MYLCIYIHISVYVLHDALHTNLTLNMKNLFIVVGFFRLAHFFAVCLFYDETKKVFVFLSKATGNGNIFMVLFICIFEAYRTAYYLYNIYINMKMIVGAKGCDY